MTPEMFADYRSDGQFWDARLPDERDRAFLDKPDVMPPGPAFIPKESVYSSVSKEESHWIRVGRMRWQDATESASGGWVRPKGQL